MDDKPDAPEDALTQAYPGVATQASSADMADGGISEPPSRDAPSEDEPPRRKPAKRRQLPPKSALPLDRLKSEQQAVDAFELEEAAASQPAAAARKWHSEAPALRAKGGQRKVPALL